MFSPRPALLLEHQQYITTSPLLTYHTERFEDEPIGSTYPISRERGCYLNATSNHPIVLSLPCLKYPIVHSRNRYTVRRTIKLGCMLQRLLYFDSFSGETPRSGAVSLSLELPNTLAVSLGLLHSKNSHFKPIHHGTMSKKKKDWRTEKGKR